MKKDIRDYLHLYFKCWGTVTESKSDMYEDGQWALSSGLLEAVMIGAAKFTPHLRPLSSMTGEEWKKCFELARGVYEQSFPFGEMMASTEVMFTLGKKQFVFGVYNCSDNDVRIGDGICVYMKSYLIEQEFSIGTEGIESTESGFNKMEKEDVQNIVHILNYLRKRGIDCDGLIDAGLALDITKQPAQ